MARAKKRPRHGMMFFSALAVAALSVFMHPGAASIRTDTPNIEEQAVLVRHGQSTSLTIIRGAREGLEVIDFAPDETASITVPSSWTLREVRGTDLATVTSAADGEGYTRYVLPADSRFSFLTDKADHLTVHDAGSGTLLLKVRIIDLMLERIQESSQLLKGSKMRVW